MVRDSRAHYIVNVGNVRFNLSNSSWLGLGKEHGFLQFLTIFRGKTNLLPVQPITLQSSAY